MNKCQWIPSKSPVLFSEKMTAFYGISTKSRHIAVFLLSTEIFCPKRNVFHRKAPATQVGQQPGIGGKTKGQLIGVEGLPRLAVAPIHIPPAVFGA